MKSIEAQELIHTASEKAPDVTDLLQQKAKMETAIGKFMLAETDLPGFLRTVRAISHAGQIIVDKVEDFNLVLQELGWRNSRTEKIIDNTINRFEMARAGKLPAKLGLQFVQGKTEPFSALVHFEFPDDMEDGKVRTILRNMLFASCDAPMK